MKIIILGSAKVSQSLACELVDEGHDVTVVSDNRSELKSMQQAYDIRTISGRPSYPDVLRRARADKADILIAVTNSDEVNMIACQAGYSLFKVPLKIAKIRSQHYLTRNELFGNDNLPVDIFLSPERLVSNNIHNLLMDNGLASSFLFQNEKVSFISIRVSDSSPIFNISWQMFLEKIGRLRAKPVAILRDNSYVTIRRNLKLKQFDEIFLFVENSHKKSLLEALELSKVRQKVRRVIIAGGGGIGSHLAKLLLENGCNVKVIEHDPATCSSLAATLGKATILEGDASERNLLFQENVEGVDVFCALTNDDEDNIISSLQAKYLGAKRVVSLVNNTEYMEIFARSDIDVFIPPQQLSISHILTDIRQEYITRVYSLCRGMSEVVSIKVLSGRAKSVVGRKIMDLLLPTGVIFVLSCRDGKISFDISSSVQEGDSLLFFISKKKYFGDLAAMFD